LLLRKFERRDDCKRLSNLQPSIQRMQRHGQQPNAEEQDIVKWSQ